MDKKEGVDTFAGFREGNISLILEDYNDMFSDFDPRPYSERALSQDFLAECKRATTDKEGVIEFRLLVPKAKRNTNEEIKIKKRLREHFYKHFLEKDIEHKKIIGEGIIWFIVGVFLIMFAVLLFDKEGFLFKILFVIMEPAGWFTMWSGLDKVFFVAKQDKGERDFYHKMADTRVYFIEY